MIRFFFFFLACWLVASLHAQQIVPSGFILASAAADPGVAGAAGLLDFRQRNNPSLPWLERVEMRTETNRFELQRQEYMTRFSVNGLQEKRLYGTLQQNETGILQAEQQQRLQEALAERYAVLAEYRSVRAAMPLRQELALVFADRISTLRQLLAAGVKTDVDDLMKAEYDLDELHLRQMEDTSMMQTALLQMAAAASLDNIVAIDTSGQIQPLQLRPALAVQSGAGRPDPSEQEQTAKIQALQTEYRLKKAESAQMLDFFQMRYANRPNEPWRNDVALSLGFRLPYSGSGKAKMAETVIEEHKATLDLEQYRQEKEQALRKADRQLEALEQQYIRQQQLLSESEQRYDLSAALAQGPEGILALLQFREAQIKRRLHLEEIAADMLDTYLLILDISGRLVEPPLVNFLSAGLEKI